MTRAMFAVVMGVALGESLAPLAGRAYSSGPPADRVGLCAARLTCKSSGCHDDYPLNSGTAASTLALETAPRPLVYRPSELIRFVLSVTDADASRTRVGFEIAAVSGCPFPQPAGTLSVVEPVRTQILGQAGIDYLEHGCVPPFDVPNCGYVPNPVAGANAWTFDWQAPPLSVGPVTFYWAINSADGNADPTGDYIATGEATLDPACPDRVRDLTAVKAACDPATPGAPRVELGFGPIPWATGARAYRTSDPAALADPPGSGATLLPSLCDDPPPGALWLYSVAGTCADGSDGPY